MPFDGASTRMDEVSTSEWLDWRASVYELEELDKFYTQWKASQCDLQKIWENFRLLPLQPAYLIASHYQYDQSGWILKTKWSIFNHFDRALSRGENLAKISSSICSAIETQRKIVALHKIFATLKDPSKTLQHRVDAFQELKIQNRDLYRDMIHKIWIAQNRLISKEKAKSEILQQSQTSYSHAVIKKMIYLFNEGYPVLNDCFFENFVDKK